MAQLITLLTDFGLEDTFVGVSKGVLKTLAPDVDIVDLTHQVPPQDIRAGAFLWKTAYRYFPSRTIHLAVVDPGVGSLRKPVAAQIGDFFFVCPDNGLLSYIVSENTLHQAVKLNKPEYHLPQVSRTFHGRDIFAPAAAHLARGVPLDTLGTPLETLETFTLPQPQVSGKTILCHVIYADVFGNVFLDMTEDQADTEELSSFTANLSGQTIPGPVPSYSAVVEGMPLMLFGSNGYLEIAARDGNAQRQFGLHIGDTVTLTRMTP